MNNLVNMRILCYIFGTQMGPVKETEVTIKETVQMAHDNGRNCAGKENCIYICTSRHAQTYLARLTMLYQLEYF
jgi:hypothetical protein